MSERRWKVGELAEATGLTVRTLHHFDEIGLVQSSERTGAGHRVYLDSDVRKLYRVLALRQLGMSLREIAASLRGDADGLAVAVRDQLAQVRRQIELQQEVQRRLAVLSRGLQEAQEPTVDQFIDAMEAMMKANYFSVDQIARMKARHGEVDGGAMARWRERWTEICAAVSAHIAAGRSPADPLVQETAREWSELMEDMTGGDRTILAGMYAKLDGQGPEAATRGVVNAEVWDFMKGAFVVGFDGQG